MLRDIPLTQVTEKTVTDKAKFKKVLEGVRDQGWSLVDQELENGLYVDCRPSSDQLGACRGCNQCRRSDVAHVAR